MKPRALSIRVLAAAALLTASCSGGHRRANPSSSAPPASVTSTTTAASTTNTSTTSTTWLLAAAKPVRRSNDALPAAEGFTPAEPWLRLGIEAASTRVAPGGSVRGVFVATNDSDGIWDITHPGSMPFHYGLFFDGVRASTGYGEEAAVHPDRMQPHEIRRSEFSIAAADSRGTPLRPGVYDLFFAVSTLWGQPCSGPVQITVT